MLRCKYKEGVTRQTWLHATPMYERLEVFVTTVRPTARQVLCCDWYDVTDVWVVWRDRGGT